MNREDIIRLVRQAANEEMEIAVLSISELEKYTALVEAAERNRIFGDLLKMHEIAKSQHNYFLHAVLTLKAKGQA